MKLSKRLQQINTMITSDYDHIWDCCCDHGLLGMSLLEQHFNDTLQNTNKPNTTIHFVDIVAKLMEELETKLNIHFNNLFQASKQTHWRTHCLDVSMLPLASYSGKHLIIIAGVGGDQTCQLINNICENNPSLTFDFLLCPVHQLYRVRKQLIQLNTVLKSEILLEENKRFYELLLVSKTSSRDKQSHQMPKMVSPTGTLIWQCEDKNSLVVAQRYLNKTLNHYKRMQLGNNNEEVAIIIDEYSKIQHLLDAQALLISRMY